MGQELKPCPFCGGEELGTTWTRVTDKKWAGVTCSDCQTELSRQTVAEAIAAWNTRATPTADEADHGE